MTQQLVDRVEQFCLYQLKQRGKTEGGVQSYRWVLEQFLVSVTLVSVSIVQPVL